MMISPFCYRATLHRIIDADTIVFSLDLGFHVSVIQSCRLWGIDCPEPSTSEGRDATGFVVRWFEGQDYVVVRTHRDRQGKYGRYLAEVFTLNGESLIDDLREAGYEKSANED